MRVRRDSIIDRMLENNYEISSELLISFSFLFNSESLTNKIDAVSESSGGRLEKSYEKGIFCVFIYDESVWGRAEDETGGELDFVISCSVSTKIKCFLHFTHRVLPWSLYKGEKQSKN